jgi:hypothetical protein
VPQQAPHPVYSTDNYFTANRDDPYQFAAVKSHYQETTSERYVCLLPVCPSTFCSLISSTCKLFLRTNSCA